MIGAGTLIPEGRQIPPHKLVVGVPGRIKGDVTPELKAHAQWGTSIYQALPPRCHKALRLID